MKEIDNFTIEELRNEYKISNRTYNRCIDAKLLTLMDLIYINFSTTILPTR